MSPQGLNFRTAVGVTSSAFQPARSNRPTTSSTLAPAAKRRRSKGRWFSDLLIGSRLWESFIFRFNKPFADDQTMRIIDLPNEELAPLYREQKVHRQLGTTFEFETSPRIVLNDYLALSGWYVYRNHKQDDYTGSFTIPAAVTGFSDITINAATLDLETRRRSTDLAAGSHSRICTRSSRGRRRFHSRCTYLHWQTVKGAGGNQPKFFTDQVQLRLYARIFGGK